MQDLQFDSSDNDSNNHDCVYYSIPSEHASDPLQVDLMQQNSELSAKTDKGSS